MCFGFLFSFQGSLVPTGSPLPFGCSAVGPVSLARRSGCECRRGGVAPPAGLLGGGLGVFWLLGYLAGFALLVPLQSKGEGFNAGHWPARGRVEVCGRATGIR